MTRHIHTHPISVSVSKKLRGSSDRRRCHTAASLGGMLWKGGGGGVDVDIGHGMGGGGALLCLIEENVQGGGGG